MKRKILYLFLLLGTFVNLVYAQPGQDTNKAVCGGLKPNQDKTFWQGWAGTAAMGLHYKTKNKSPRPGISTTRIGPLVTAGVRWQKNFKSNFFFTPELVWGLFLPDMFVNKVDFHFNLLGKKRSIPFSWAILIPMPSLQLGYASNTNLQFSLGLFNLSAFALEANFRYPIFKKCSLDTRLCLFMDKILFDKGIHNGFLTLGISRKF